MLKILNPENLLPSERLAPACGVPPEALPCCSGLLGVAHFARLHFRLEAKPEPAWILAHKRNPVEYYV